MRPVRVIRGYSWRSAATGLIFKTRLAAGGPITASPAVAAGRLVIGTTEGVLYCFG